MSVGAKIDRMEKRFRIAQDAETQPTEQQLAAQKVFREAIVNAAIHLDLDAPEGREKKLAMIKLEEALLWAGKAIFS